MNNRNWRFVSWCATSWVVLATIGALIAGDSRYLPPAMKEPKPGKRDLNSQWLQYVPDFTSSDSRCGETYGR